MTAVAAVSSAFTREIRECDLGDAEVEDLDATGAVGALGEEEVRGLEVAVDDAERVGLGDRLARLEDEVDGLHRSAGAPVRSRRVARSSPSRYSMTMNGPPDLERADVDDARDVLALDADGGARLAGEARRRPPTF